MQMHNLHWFSFNIGSTTTNTSLVTKAIIVVCNVKTGFSQCEHIRNLSFSMSIISCPDFWRRITPHDDCMEMHGRSAFGVWGKLYKTVVVRMMRMRGCALMGRKKKEGLGRTERWRNGRRGRRRWTAGRFLVRKQEKGAEEDG